MTVTNMPQYDRRFFSTKVVKIYKFTAPFYLNRKVEREKKISRIRCVEIEKQLQDRFRLWKWKDELSFIQSVIKDTRIVAWKVLEMR